MHKFAAFLLMTAGCASVNRAGVPTVATAAEPAPPIDLLLAQRFIAELDAMCAADGGKLWGRSLAGPLIFVDPVTRYAVSNRADTRGVLKAKGTLFVGPLSDDVLLANTAVEWDGSRWTMVIWASLVDAPNAQRRKLLAHEAFHRVQPELGLRVPDDLNTHLDTKDGRVLMQLEWGALEVALNAHDVARIRAVGDALAFRKARQAQFAHAQLRESQLEVNEGLAEYSGARLAEYSAADVVKTGQAKRENETSFVRSFAYISGPLYGYLLDSVSPNWRQQVTNNSDLGSLLEKLAAVPPSHGSVQTLAKRYNGVALFAAEEARAVKRQQQTAEWRRTLIDGPVLIVPLERGNGTFDPRCIFPLSDTETVYFSRELTGSWGTLAVDESPLLQDKTLERATVSLHGAAPDGSRGPSWTLKLAPGWTTAPGERRGDLRVVPTP